MKIDVFNFNDEFVLLELRLRENWDFFDKFILIEGDHYFSGKKRDILKNNQFFLKKFTWAKDKLLIYTAALSSNVSSGFTNDFLQKKFTEKILLKNFNENDIIFWGAVDEIPNVKFFKEKMNKVNFPVVLEQKLFYYFFNGEVINHLWYGTIVFKNELLKFKDLDHLDKNKYFAKGFNIIKNGGWHFSYLGSISTILNKIKTFAHQEYNNTGYLDEKKILRQIKKGKDLFFRKTGDPNLGGKNEMIIKYVKIDKNFPKFLIKNKKQYKQYFNSVDLHFFKQYFILKQYFYFFIVQFLKKIKIFFNILK
jgi:beta-1,4-mannosyl-glycoprotein beta-1,4-N-acetylglucosaminyltransferase